MSTANSSSLCVKAIDHITLVVKDLARSSRFYGEVLGMQPIDRPDFAFAGRWFQAGNTQIHMNLEGAEAGRAGLPPLAAKSPSRGFHFAFEVDDCDGAASRLGQLGIPIVSGPRSRPDGARQLYIYDPDGHLVEIYSRSAPSR
jgi:catechol 2,3-dioxygenase-like lactoylglutathione lyase family enzyme